MGSIDPGSLAFGVLILVTLASVPTARLLGPAAGYPIGAGLAVATAALVTGAPDVLAGRSFVASVPWVPSLGLHLTLVLDALALLFALLVCGIGAIVFAYSARYFRRGEPVARVYGLLALFATSMLGLVLAGDLLFLFVCWELTSLTSFFLIGGAGRGSSGREARVALLITGLGGLALLAAVLLTVNATGSSDIGSLLTDPQALSGHATGTAIAALVIVAAFTKSAQVPFHFWLPRAMVAPTPISTYLHAATMVKAGIYLLARTSPIFAGVPGWKLTLVLTGLITAVAGAVLALAQYDLKALLAYSTISQLGFIVALVGVGTHAAMVAAAVHTIAHAGYKATLFMVVGILDREAGSKDIRHLSGLRHAMPVTAGVTALAAVSMAGLPPFLGFVSKEEAFSAFTGGWLGPFSGALAVVAAVVTFAYGARIFDGTFAGPLTQERLYEPRATFLAPAAVTAVGGLALGLYPGVLDPLVNGVAAVTTTEVGAAHLALWHGVTPTLGMSAVTIASGLVLYAGRRRLDDFLHRYPPPVSASTTFDTLLEQTSSLGRWVARPFRSLAPAVHIGWLVGAVVVLGVAGWLAFGTVAPTPAPSSEPEDWGIFALLVTAAAGAAVARHRLATVALVGLVGFLLAVLYVVLGAPDLALTQVLIETLTVVLVVLVFRRFPATFPSIGRRRRLAAALGGASVGIVAALGTYAIVGRREISRAGTYFIERSVEEAGGANAVNTILVDFRALDTLGEITVVAAAALGVFAVTRLGKEDSDAP